MRLFLIRHGETDSNVNHLLDTAYPGAPLNENGHQQAQSLIERLADIPFTAIYASTLIRAQETATPLAAARGLEVQVLDGIQEISAGVEEMNSNWQVYIDVLETWAPDNMDVGLEGGETARDFLTRYTEAIRKIEADGHEVAALVSHGAAMRVFGITADPKLDLKSAPRLLNTEWIELDGSSDEGWNVRRWGSRAFD